ncbi:O-antigen ligase family protein [Candidatus Peregrinibacteria bacterium]|nr:O-antigen ligase family protein [Candidatus Peregrinibacteria bacterium]
MQNLKDKIAILGVTVLMILSFLALDAAKYDTANRIWLVLLIGCAAVFIPLLLTFKGIGEHPLLSSTVLLWCALVWVSFYFSQTKNYGFSEAIVYTVIPLLGLSLSTLKSANWRLLRQIFVFFAIASALYGFWYFPTHGEARMAGLFLEARDPRHFFPNTFANFLLMTWPLVIFADTVKKRRLKCLLLSILFTALYLTFSRGAWIMLAIQLVALCFYAKIHAWRLTKKDIAKCIAGVAVTSLILINLLTQLRALNFHTNSLVSKVLFENAESSTSVNERKDSWLGSLELMKESPLFGFGPMSFRYAYAGIQKNLLAISDHPHNWILKIGVESGIPAAAVFTIFLALLFYKILKERWRFSVYLLGIALLGGMLHNMMDFNMNFIPTILVFFALIGAVLQHTDKSKNKIAGFALIMLWAIAIAAVTVMSFNEVKITLAQHANKGDPFSYKDSQMPRNFFMGEAEKNIKSEDTDSATALLNIHLKFNPLDARAWFLKGNYAKAIELDPLNNLAYYRGYLETNPDASPEFRENLMSILVAYESILKVDLHYTAFSSNPDDAARIYELLGIPSKAIEIKREAQQIQKDFAERMDFNKQLVPRTIFGGL